MDISINHGRPNINNIVFSYVVLVGTPPLPLMTRGAPCCPEQLHPDSLKRDTWCAPLSGLPQEEAHDTRKHHVRTIAYPIRI